MALTGHEDRFRQLYADEAHDRLGRMTTALLEVGDEAGDDVLEVLFREAHTLKGGAAIVGFPDVSRAVHAVEDVLEGVRDGSVALRDRLRDALLDAVEALGTLITESRAGEDVTAAADAIVAAINDVASRPQEAAPEATEAPPTVSAAPPEAATAGLEAGAAAPVPAGPPDPAPDNTGSDESAPAGAGRKRRADAGGTVRVSLDRLDLLSRLVSEAAAAHLSIGRVLTERLGGHPELVEEFRRLSLILGDLQEQAMRARMVPVSELVPQLHRAVHNAARSLGRDVRWEVRGEDTELDRGVLDRLADPLQHLVRNCVAHGIEAPDVRLAAGKPATGTVRLHAMQIGAEVVVVVSDDGRGIDTTAVRNAAAERGADVATLGEEELTDLVFTPGLSTSAAVSEVSGRGVGLDVVRATLQELRGRVEVHSQPGQGAEFRLIVPLTLAVSRCLLVRAGARRYALPLTAVVRALPPQAANGHHIGGDPVVWLDERPVALCSLAQALGRDPEDGHGPVVIVAGTTRTHAFAVDEVLGQRDVVVKGLSPLLPPVDVVAGASVEPDGSVLLVLDPGALVQAGRRSHGNGVSGAQEAPSEERPSATILVVDDAMTVRELQRSILERAGFRVRLARDGVEALSDLAELRSDLILSDVEMPRMDGFELVTNIRSQPALAHLPVILLTSRSSEEDRQRGLQAGADAYIIKSSFDAATLISAVERLLQAPA